MSLNFSNQFKYHEDFQFEKILYIIIRIEISIIDLKISTTTKNFSLFENILEKQQQQKFNCCLTTKK